MVGEPERADVDEAEDEEADDGVLRRLEDFLERFRSLSLDEPEEERRCLVPRE